MWGHKQRTIDALRHRVEELEERLCPCGQHEWVDTGKRDYEYAGACVDVLIWYKCKRCGKVKQDWAWL